jgi:hypothetical protein
MASLSGSVTSTGNTASFYGPGSILFSGMKEPKLPTGAVIQGIYAVEAYTASGVANGATLAMNTPGQTFYSVSKNGIGVGASTTLGISAPSYIGASLSGASSINITSAALAYCYTIPNNPSQGPNGGGVGGGGGGTVGSPGNGIPETQSLALVDPYMLPNESLINANDVVTSNLVPAHWESLQTERPPQLRFIRATCPGT